jgi:hypothetical protein
VLIQTKEPTNKPWIFPRIWSAFLLGLIGCSYRLWISPAELPAVPLLGIATVVPDWISGILTGALVISAASIVILPRSTAWRWWMVAAMLGGLFLLDQHRLQPWAYQTCIYALIFATLCPATARGWILPLAASIYVYSALGKFDYQFVHTVGIELLETASKPFGGLPDTLDLDTRASIAHLFPVTELLAGLFLFPRRTRQIAGVAVMLLHGSLIGLLGPWGLDHSAGVLLWNVLLLVQAWLLFVAPVRTAVDDGAAGETKLFPLPARQNDRHRAGLIACLAVLLAMVMPVFERTGYWDHWLSWALYAPHNSRAEVEIHRSGIELLPPAAGEFVEDDLDDDGWHELSLDRWSLASLGVPIYPQARYQLGLAVALAQRSGLDNNLRARLRGVSDRRTGKRTEQRLLDVGEMRAALDDFWLVPHAGQFEGR